MNKLLADAIKTVSLEKEQTAGLEGIDFQKNRAFGDALAEAVEGIRRDRQMKDSALDRISVVIKKYTNMTTKLKLLDDVNAWVQPPLFDKDHVFYDDYKEYAERDPRIRKALEEDVTKLFRETEIVRGSVDMRTGKVHGDFEKVQIEMGYGKEFFKPNSAFTPGQVAAIILHETGHAFHAFEFLVRLSTTNYIMEEAVQVLTGTNNRNIHMAFIKEANKKGFVVIDNDLLDVKGAEAVRLIVLKKAMEKSKAELGYNLYDRRGFEMLADQFAIRMGYGKELSTGLYTLNQMFEMPTRGNFFDLMQAVFAEIFMYVVSLGILFVIVVIWGMPNTTYDGENHRHQVIIQQMRQSLKRPGITQQEKITTIEAIDTLTRLWGEFTKDPANLPIAELFWKMLPGKSGQIFSMKVQKEVERILNNRMAEAAARIEVGTYA